jgi:hypothetical protein
MALADYAIFADNLVSDVDRLLSDEPKDIRPAGNESTEEYLRRAISWVSRCKKELLPLASQVENQTQHAFVEQIFQRLHVSGWNWTTPMSGTTAERIRGQTTADLRESRSALHSLSDFISRLRPPLGPTDGIVVRPNPYLLVAAPGRVVPKTVFAVMAWDLKGTVLEHVRSILEPQGYKVTWAGDRGGQVIFDDIWRFMTEAEAVLVDFTGRKPNVYLEFGMAIVLGKPVVAITQDKADLPSDTPNLKYIEYPNQIGDKTLEQRLPRVLEDTVRDITTRRRQ